MSIKHLHEIPAGSPHVGAINTGGVTPQGVTPLGYKHLSIFDLQLAISQKQYKIAP